MRLTGAVRVQPAPVTRITSAAPEGGMIMGINHVQITVPGNAVAEAGRKAR
jgi:hypothetical protein